MDSEKWVMNRFSKLILKKDSVIPQRQIRSVVQIAVKVNI